jgi:hypothetical protein
MYVFRLGGGRNRRGAVLVGALVYVRADLPSRLCDSVRSEALCHACQRALLLPFVSSGSLPLNPGYQLRTSSSLIHHIPLSSPLPLIIRGNPNLGRAIDHLRTHCVSLPRGCRREHGDPCSSGSCFGRHKSAPKTFMPSRSIGQRPTTIPAKITGARKFKFGTTEHRRSISAAASSGRATSRTAFFHNAGLALRQCQYIIPFHCRLALRRVSFSTRAVIL